MDSIEFETDPDDPDLEEFTALSQKAPASAAEMFCSSRVAVVVVGTEGREVGIGRQS